MESWVNGKRHLLQEFGKVYDLIGANLAAGEPLLPQLPSHVSDIIWIELDEDNTARVSHEELHALQEKSTRCDELAEENARLSEELKRYKDASLRVDGLEKDNKRLQGDLKLALQKQQQTFSTLARPNHIFSDIALTPVPIETPAVQRIENDEGNPVSKESYRALVAKHNAVYEQWSGQRDARNKFEERWNKEKEKVRNWHKYCDGQDKTIAKKDDKIQRLEEEIQKLRSRPSSGRDAPQNDLAVERLGPSDLVSADQGPQLPAPTAEALEGGARSSEGPMITGSTANIVPGYTVDPGSEMPAWRQNQNPELPKLLNSVKNVIHDSEEDIEPESELLNEHHSSSTEEDTNPVPQDDFQDRDGAIKEEAVEAQSLPEDTPVVISARRVKKRKGSHQPEQQIAVSKVKYEVLSSSPVGLARLLYLDHNESIDLDEIGEKVDTPKKQRRLLELSGGRRAISQDTDSFRQSGSQNQDHSYSRADSEQMSQETPIRGIGLSRTGSALQPLSVNKQILPRTSEDRTIKRRRIVSDKAVADLLEDGEIAASVRRAGRRNASELSEKLGDLLAKPSPPKHILSPSRLSNSVRRQGKTPARSVLALHREDLRDRRLESSKPNKTRENLDQSRPSSSSSKTVSGGSTEVSRPSSNGSAEPQQPSSDGSSRSSVALSRPASGGMPNNVRASRSPGRNTPLASAWPSSRGSMGCFAEPSRPILAKATSRRSKDASRPASIRKRQFRAEQTTANRAIDLGQKPLRTRPIDILRLEDFKVNPNYNQGYNYAFSDVVRNKDDRRCLQGCTKPGCCGEKFRALAAITRNTGKPLTMSQEEADEDLLHEFLGDNAYKLRNMTESEREEVLLQARTRELANKHGRHRHAYERPVSPPGFWRADFPTTQEELLDRERARDSERDQVMQRYEQAMRPGGAYMFRDE
jgi:hypothetical protein